MNDKELKDFDSALKESDKGELNFKLNSKEYTVPAEIPARVVLAQMRYMDETGGLPSNYVPDWLESLLGKELMEEIIEGGATWPQLEALLNWLLDEYGIGAGDEETVESEGDEDSPK